MAQPQTAPARPLPLPIRGLNTRDPLHAMSQEYATWALNIDPETQFLKARKGFHVHCDLTDITANVLALQLVNYQNDELFCYVNSDDGLTNAKVIDVETEDSPSTAFDTGATQPASAVNYTWIAYQGYIACFGESTNCDAQYDGTTWAAFAFNQAGTSGTDYKGRRYLGGGSANKLVYSELGAVSGSVQGFAVEYVFRGDLAPAWMAVLSSSTNVANDMYLAMGNLDGEILIYAGDSPEIANWELIARFQTGKLLGYQSALEFNNDVLLLTENGVVSLRRLFQNGGEIIENTLISGQITPYWTEHIRQLGGAGTVGSKNASLCWWPERNLICILLNGFLEQDGTFTAATSAATIYKYNVVSGGWTVSKVKSSNVDEGARSITYFKDNIYYIVDKVVMKEARSGNLYQDEDPTDEGTFTDIPIELHSAYTNLGSDYKYKRIHGFDAIIKTDFDGADIGVKAQSDFGRKVSGKTNPGLQSGFSNPLYACGVEGTYLQYQFSGETKTTSTDGWELYSVGVVVT